MRYEDTLVSVGLPVRNGADRIERVVKSVLEQDHEDVQLVICDNASTDDTEEVCRGFLAQDSRITYHRHPVNVGILNNFQSALGLAKGAFFRWVGDDDWLDPRLVSRCLETFAADDRLLLVTTQMAYTDSDGVVHTAPYSGTALGSDDPVTRFTEMLALISGRFPEMQRVQNKGLVMDPLYGIFRRERVMRIERRNTMNEDEVFAAKLALAGPWGHVSEVLARRNRKPESLSAVARKLDVPSWQSHFVTELQCKELLSWLDSCDLNLEQRRRATWAVGRMYMRRRNNTAVRRGRKIFGIARELAGR
jgi:glycosyltransferase involved in cell wall biosynthesis